jgi:hypothetical protein
MPMTRALRRLLQAQKSDQSFPYLEFAGTFEAVEGWITRGGRDYLERLESASEVDLFGSCLTEEQDDVKLRFVANLLVSHAQEIWHRLGSESPSNESQASQAILN